MDRLSDGEHMLSNLQWRRTDRDGGIRPLRGFTTGLLTINGTSVGVAARFTDQNLSNRFSDLEEDGTPIEIQVSLLSEDEVFSIPVGAPSLERAGACYVLRATGQIHDSNAVHSA